MKQKFDTEYDVIVVGGGPSGSMAALAAARENVRVLLIEHYGFLGGSLTAMGVGPMMTFHNNAGEQVIRGYPQELIDRMIANGASPGHVVDTTTYVSTVTPFNSERLKIELECMLSEANVDILFHTMLVSVEVKNGVIESISVVNKAGLMTFKAAIYIDSTGDGDLASWAGVPFEQGRSSNGLTQPMTMNLKVANVDRERLIQYMESHPEDCLFEYGAEQGIQSLKTSPRLSVKTFIHELQAASERGEISFYREYMLAFETGDKGTFIVNVSRIQGMDSTNPFDLSRAEMIGRRQCLEIFNFLKKYGAGFENAIRVDSAAQVGVRESRRMIGLYTIQANDLLESRQFEDSIALGGYPIDIHAPEGKGTQTTFFKKGTTYSIPLRALLNETVKNLVVNGRCISSTTEAFAGIRTTPTMMAIGQGAGVVAGMSARKAVIPHQLSNSEIQERLISTDALIAPSNDFFLYSDDFGKDAAITDPNESIL